MTDICRVIGVLDNGIEGLTPTALTCLQSADLVIGGTRTLELFAEILAQTETRDFTFLMKQMPDWIRAAQKQHQQVVVLATGDPLCHGIASFLNKKLGSDNIEIIPNVSSIQWAFAKLKMSWQNAKIVSVHNKDTNEWNPGAGPEHGLYSLLQELVSHDKLAVLTSPENSPSRIARMLVIENLDQHFEIAVAENLLQEDERLVQGETVAAIAEQKFNGNNVVVLWRKQAKKYPVQFGLADDRFFQRKPEKGLITKREVRAVSLARMQLTATSVVWDIGAGSGSVGLEAARLCRLGHVYAIEKNTADVAIAGKNDAAMDIHNYTLIHGKAPQGLDDWIEPNAVFFGGSGGELSGLIEYCLQRLNAQGWLVMNFVTMENLSVALETLKNCQANWDITQLQASRSQPILHMHRLKAENPVWIVSAQRGEA